MGKYDAEVQDALDAITEAGEASTVIRYTGTVPDEVNKPWDTGDAVPEELPVAAVFLNYNLTGSGEGYVDGSLVLKGDKKVLIAGGLAWRPPVGGAVRRADGSMWSIVNVKTLDPDGQDILYTLQVRQ